MHSQFKVCLLFCAAIACGCVDLQENRSTLVDVEPEAGEDFIEIEPVALAEEEHAQGTEEEEANEAEYDEEDEHVDLPFGDADGNPDVFPQLEEERQDVPTGAEELTLDHLKSLHSQMDADHDGKVSMAEVLALANKLRIVEAKKTAFDELLEDVDHDKNGKLELKEILAPVENQDQLDELGKSEAEKFKESETAKFKAADRNADGALEGDELRLFYFPEMDDEMLNVVSASSLKRKDADGNGKLTNLELFEVHDGATAESSLSEEDRSDFALLDKDGSGTLDVHELKAWESGSFHVEKDMKKLLELADRDEDSTLTMDELEDDHYEIATGDMEPRLYQWASMITDL